MSPPRIVAADLVPEIPRGVSPATPDPAIHSIQKICEPTRSPAENPQSETDSRCAKAANTPWNQALACLDPKKRKFLPIDEGTSQLDIDSIIEVAGIKKAQCVEKRWKFRVGDTTFDLSERAENIISCVNKLKEIGDITVQYDAGHAALPWAAIRLVLQVRYNMISHHHC